MTEIARYIMTDQLYGSTAHVSHTINPQGEWVKYADHQARIAELEGRIKMLAPRFEEARRANEAEAKVAQLEATLATVQANCLKLLEARQAENVKWRYDDQ
jgi:hypothetical protein